MKTLLTLIAFVCLTSQAFSQEAVTNLEKGDMNLSNAEAKIVSVRPICPRVPGRMTCMAIGSVVTVEVTLNGCLDRLGGYFAKFDFVDNKGILHFGAINIFNKASMTARCVKIPTKRIDLHVPFEGQIELEEMNYTGMNL